jgi:hypothetical protein
MNASTSTDRRLSDLNPDLFRGVEYYINDDVDNLTQQEIRQLLSLGGAQETDTTMAIASSTSDSTARFSLDSVTHVIAMRNDFPEYASCLEPYGTDIKNTQQPIVITVSSRRVV